MKQSVRSAIAAAVFFTCVTAFFGHSLFRRLSMVYSQTAAIKKQINEWAQSGDGRDFQSLMDELHQYDIKRTAADVQRQVAARQAATAASLINQVQQTLETQHGSIARLHDRFEDEFGRRIERNKDAPRQYEVGPAPTLSSDPFRYLQRKALWNAADLAVTTYNSLLIQSRPDLDRYERELKAQQQVIEEATAQWENLSRTYEDVKRKIKVLQKNPREGLPSAEELSRKLKNSTTVAAVFGISDFLALISAAALALAVWVRTALIAGWIPESRILAE